jgi:hypothetical protein
MKQRAQSKKRYSPQAISQAARCYTVRSCFDCARAESLSDLWRGGQPQKLDQAPPEGFTFLGIIGSLLIMASSRWLSSSCSATPEKC